MNTLTICPNCQSSVLSSYYFCPNCGKKLSEKPLSTSLGKQTLIYFVSFFLPPFGLGWCWTYARSADAKARVIGTIGFLLNFVSIAITIGIVVGVMNEYAKILNTFSY